MGENDDTDSRTARLTALFRAHAPVLYRFARRLTSTADEALDLVQETFLRTAQSFDRLPTGESAEHAWLVRILLNIRRDQWRRDSVRHQFADNVARLPTQRIDPESSYIDRDTVWRALDVLTPRRRAVVTLFELDGLSVAEIATALGVSTVTVRWHLSRGRRELARILGAGRSDSHEASHANLESRRPAGSRTVTR